MRGILYRSRHKRRHDFLRRAFSLLVLLFGIGAFIGILVYVTFLFYDRKFDVLPQWVLKVFVPKTADGSEVLIKYTEARVKRCNIIFLTVGSLTGILALASWIAFSPKKSKAKSTFLIASFVISFIGGLSVVLRLGIPLWLKIVLTATGSFVWLFLYPFSMGEPRNKKDDEDEDGDASLWVCAAAMAMLDFTAACWIFAGAAGWWC